MKNKVVKNTVLYSVIVLFVALGVWLYFLLGSGGVSVADNAHKAKDHKADTKVEKVYIEETRAQEPGGADPAYAEYIENVTEDIEANTADVVDNEPVAQMDMTDGGNGVEQAESEYPCEFNDFIGKNVDELPLDEMERPYRILETGSMYTMDYIAERVNIFTDEQGVVVRIKCG